MKDELYINGYDAYSTWGIGFEDGAIASLMTPAPMKDYISNSSRLEHGTRIYAASAKYNQREITLQFYLCARSKADYIAKMAAFSENVLKTGKVIIYDKKHTGKYYRCFYNSCSSYSHNINGLSKFTLKLTEPDPTDTAETTIHTETWD